MATEQEVLDKLLETNSNLVNMMTGDENSTVTIDGVEHPTFKKFIKDNLFIDLNAIKNKTLVIKNETQALKDATDANVATIQALKDATDANVATIQALKSDIEAIKTDIDAALFDMRQNASAVKSYKESINDYVGQLELRLRELNTKLTEADEKFKSTKDLATIITQKAGEVKADKLTVVEYLTARPNQPVNEYSYSNGSLVKSPCANFSMLHYLEKIMSQIVSSVTECTEYITITLDNNKTETLCVKNSASGDEVIELELEDGTIENITIRGNP